jgi:AcrR family transcriptional regulator
MATEMLPPFQAVEPRHEAVLTAAVAVFARFGYRKTSMDEVARAAGVSRQGLYLLFADKDELFRKAVNFKLAQLLRAAMLALSNCTESLESRLVAACDEWCGRAVGMLGGDAADLMCASNAVAGATLAYYHDQFERAMSDVIADSPLMNFCAAAGVSPMDVAKALHATARGLKQSCTSRDEFGSAITAAVRMFCAPLSINGPPQE